MRKRKPGMGRPAGARNQRIDVQGCVYVYGKPFVDAGKWRTRRRLRTGGSVTKLTLDKAENLGQAITDVVALAEAQAHAAREAVKPDAERQFVPIAIGTAWENYIAKLEADGKRPSTIRQCKSEKKWALGILKEDTLAHEITLADLDRLSASLSAKSGRTRIMYMREVKAVFNFLKDHEHIRANPAERFRIPRDWGLAARVSAEKVGRRLTAEEARVLLEESRAKFSVNTTPKKYKSKENPGDTFEHEPRQALRVLLAIAFLSGLRRANLAGPQGLRWGDCDLTEGSERLNIDESRMKSKRPFSVPMNRELATLLRSHWNAERLRLKRVPLAHECVVAEALDYRRAFETLTRRLGLPVSFHDTRRSFSAWIAESAPFFVVERLLDHSPAASTTHLYVGRSIPEALLREHLDKLPRLLEAPVATGSTTSCTAPPHVVG